MQDVQKPKINKKIHSSCHDCIFAEFNDIRQSGCKLNVLSKWKERGNAVEVYNDKGEFYVINNRLCMHKRKDNWIHAKLPLNQQVTEVGKELQFTYQAVIFLDGQLEGLDWTISQLSQQKISPVHLTVVNQFGRFRNKPTEISKILEKHNICPWKIESQMKSMIDEYGFHKDERRGLLDLVIKFTPKAPYYLVLSSGASISDKLSERMDYKINRDLDNILMIRGDNSMHEMVVNYMVHKGLQGNVHESLEDKIERLEGKIWTMTEIFQ